MLVGRCSSELSSHKLQAKLKKSQALRLNGSLWYQTPSRPGGPPAKRQPSPEGWVELIAARMFCWKSKSRLIRGSSNTQRANLAAYLGEDEFAPESKGA